MSSPVCRCQIMVFPNAWALACMQQRMNANRDVKKPHHAGAVLVVWLTYIDTFRLLACPNAPASFK